jgi:hypothetical protein
MGTYIPENMKGRLFNNQADKTKDKQPDWAGTAVVNGVHVHISGWYYPPSERNRVGQISLAIEDYQERADRIAAQKAAKAGKAAGDMGQGPGTTIPGGATGDGNFDDDIPF